MESEWEDEGEREEGKRFISVPSLWSHLFPSSLLFILVSNPLLPCFLLFALISFLPPLFCSSLSSPSLPITPFFSLSVPSHLLLFSSQLFLSFRCHLLPSLRSCIIFFPSLCSSLSSPSFLLPPLSVDFLPFTLTSFPVLRPDLLLFSTCLFPFISFPSFGYHLLSFSLPLFALISFLLFAFPSQILPFCKANYIRTLFPYPFPFLSLLYLLFFAFLSRKLLSYSLSR